MPWYRFEKFFQGGSHHDYLFLEPLEGKKKITHDQLQEMMRDWGERTNGGHNYGYRVYCRYAKRVPLKVLKGKLEATEKYKSSMLPNFFDAQHGVNKKIRFLKNQIEKQKRSKK